MIVGFIERTEHAHSATNEPVNNFPMHQSRQSLFLLVLVLTLCVTQKITGQGFKAGVKFGTNINKLKGQSFSNSFTFGYHAGAFAEIKLSEHWHLQPELLFQQINADTSSEFRTIYTITADRIAAIKLNYLTIPLLIGYKVSKLMMVQGGIQYGILMNRDLDLLQNGTQAFKSGDFSVLAGLQFKLAGIRVYGRYAVGLQNINNLLGDKDTWKSQTIQIGLGISII